VPLLAALLLLAGGCGQAKRGAALSIPAPARLPRSTTSHVIVVVMENKEDAEVIGNSAAPYANQLARRYGRATQSYAIRHPSLPNYLALTSGSTHGIDSDCTDCRVAGANIVDQLQARGISWRAYLEGQPGTCFKGSAAGGYAKKHNPFAYYDDIVGSPSRCRNLVGFGRLASDLRQGHLPTYSWLSPNLCDDTHDCGVGAGDGFLRRTIPALLRELGPQGFLVLTWDEGNSDQGCCGAAARGGHVATILAGPDVRPGSTDAEPVDHYGVLATIESALGLAPLGGAADPRNGRLTPLFKHAPHIS
jgi:phosphatidylinositol-3-phosphatase